MTHTGQSRNGDRHRLAILGMGRDTHRPDLEWGGIYTGQTKKEEGHTLARLGMRGTYTGQTMNEEGYTMARLGLWRETHWP